MLFQEIVHENQSVADSKVYLSELKELESSLNAAKQRIEPLEETYPQIRKVLRVFHPFNESYRYKIVNRNLQIATNAWFKIWEILHKFKLINSEDKETFVHFDNCALPGSFIAAVHHMVKQTCRGRESVWYAASDESKDERLRDVYELKKRNRESWIDNGDVTSSDYIRKLAEMHIKADLYTSDYGIDITTPKQFDRAEELHAKGQLGQLAAGLTLLKQGGSMVLKLFTFFNPFTISLIGFASMMFNNAYICKPIASKQDNSEVYLVCTGFTFDSTDELDETIESILQILDNVDFDWVNGTISPIEQLSKKFWESVTNAAKMIFNRQIKSINEHHNNAVNALADSKDNFNESKNNIASAQSIAIEYCKEQYSKILEGWLHLHPIRKLNDADKLNCITPERPPKWEHVKPKHTKPRYFKPVVATSSDTIKNEALSSLRAIIGKTAQI